MNKSSFYKRDAKRHGISVEQYISHIELGHKKCRKCNEWLQLNAFPVDNSRADGKGYVCFNCKRVKEKKPIVITKLMREALAERNRKNKWRQGVPLSLEHRQQLREARIKEGTEGTGSFYGSNNPNWKGGVTPENHILRNNAEYNQWRTAVFTRDKYTCQKCKDDKGGNLEAHHIKDWSNYPELRYDVDNGTTLCRTCHGEAHDKPDSYRKRRKVKRATRT